MTTSFLPIGKCVILSVLHQQSNILKAWHLINIHRKMVVGKGGGWGCSLPFFPLYLLFAYFCIFYNTWPIKRRGQKRHRIPIFKPLCLWTTKQVQVLPFFFCCPTKK